MLAHKQLQMVVLVAAGVGMALAQGLAAQEHLGRDLQAVRRPEAVTIKAVLVVAAQGQWASV